MGVFPESVRCGGGGFLSTVPRRSTPLFFQQAGRFILLYALCVLWSIVPMGSLTLYTPAAPVPLHPLSLFAAFRSFSERQPSRIEHRSSASVSWAVLSKVSSDFTTPAPKLSVVSSFRWGGLAHPECRDRHLPDPGGRSGLCRHLPAGGPD